MCWARTHPLFQGFHKVITRIPLDMWGAEGEESQRGRKKARRGEKKERGVEFQTQGQTPWPGDLENHFPFPSSDFSKVETRTGAFCQAACSGVDRGRGCQHRHLGFTHCPCTGAPPSLSARHRVHCGETSVTSHQKLNLPFYSLLAPM